MGIHPPFDGSSASNHVIKDFTNLSRSISHRFRYKNYTVVSLPKGMEIIDGEFCVAEKVPTIAIIDVFSDWGYISIAPRTKVSHGALVTKYAVKGLEDKVGVLAFDMTPVRSRMDEVDESKGLQEALEELVEIQKQHQNIMALNLSVGVNKSYETPYDDLLILLSKYNIEEKKEEVLECLRKEKKGIYALAYQMIRSINQLVDAGVVVYSASGNKKDFGLELLSLSKAQHIVSAFDYSKANHIFSTDAADGVHVFHRKYRADGQLLSIADGRIEFLPSEIPKSKRTTRGKYTFFLFPKKVRGTSYSSPIKLNEDLKSILDS